MARNTSAVVDLPDRVAALEAALQSGKDSTRRRPGPPCSLGTVLSTLPDETAAKVRAALADERNSNAELADMLINAGFDVSAYTVGRHRRRGAANGCRCSA